MSKGKSPYARRNKRPYDYSHVWEKYPYLRPGAQGVGAKRRELDVDINNARHSQKHQRTLREAVEA